MEEVIIKTKYRMNENSKNYIKEIKQLMLKKYDIHVGNKEIVESALAKMYKEMGLNEK